MNTNLDHVSHELDNLKFESKLSFLSSLWPFENCSKTMNGRCLSRKICHDLYLPCFLRECSSSNNLDSITQL